MHSWDDPGVDWKGIDAAASYIGDFCRRWARLGGQTKEKFGQIRFYARFSNMSLHGLIYPGYVYSQFPKWLWRTDISYITPVLEFLFGKLFHKWQTFIYRQAYKRAVKKWPHLRKEILSAADQDQLLKGI